MNDNERSESIDILFNAVRISNKYGPLILDDADNIGGTAATAAAVMLTQYSTAMGMNLHDTMSLFMAVYKQTIVMEREDEADQ
jgi:hypothetical protein